MADSGDNVARHRKPSALASTEGARGEKALELKRSKSGYIGRLTKYYNEVRDIIERSENYVDIELVLRIKDKISTTFDIFVECHTEYLEFLREENSRDEAVKIYRDQCLVKCDVEEQIDSWISNMRERNWSAPEPTPFLMRPADSASQSGSDTSSKRSGGSRLSTTSKLKIKAEARHAVALLKLKQLEETQVLQDQIDEVELKMKLEEAMKLNKMKRKQVFLEARHEAERRNTELQIYEKSEMHDENVELHDLDYETAEKTELHIKGKPEKTELHIKEDTREKPELHDMRNTEPYESQRTYNLQNRYPFQDNEPSHDHEPIFVTPPKQSTPKESTRVVSKNPFSTNPFMCPAMETKQDITIPMAETVTKGHTIAGTPSTPTAEEWLAMNSTNLLESHCFTDFYPNVENDSSKDNEVYNEMIKQQERMVSTMANALMLPKPELFTFDGNPLHYWRFVRNFERNIEQKSTDEGERLNYLLQYCSGKAREVVRNCVVMEPSIGYATARRLLKERFGEPYVIASAYMEQITKGPPLRASDREGLLNFADKLKDCELTIKSIGYLDDLNSADNLRQIAERFPIHLKARWLDLTRVIRNGGGKPNIGQMSEFITERAMAANDPVFGNIMEIKDQVKIEKPRQRHRPARVSAPRATALATQAEKPKVSDIPSIAFNTLNNKPPQTQTTKCWLCEGTHVLASCCEFEKKTHEDRVKFVRDKGLCDNCYKRGHKARECFQKGQCKIEGCEGKHHTLLHAPTNNAQKDNEKPPGSKSNYAVNLDSKGVSKPTGEGRKGKVCLPIVPVRIRGKGRNTTVTTYALLDKGSDTSLCEQRLLEQLNVDGEERTFSLTTIDKVKSQKRGRIASLEVMSLESDEVIEIPAVWSVDRLCISTEGAPTQQDLYKWSHLDGITVPEIDSSEVALLIGNDTPEVFWALEERRGNRKEPYAVKSLLGWTIVGPVDDATNRNSLNTCFITLQDDELKQQVERFWKTDFGDPILSIKESMSVEDRRALSIMEESAVLVGGHYEVSLPWKHGEPCILNNRQLAESRLESLKRRFLKDPEVHQRYKAVIDDHLDKGYARRIPEESQNPSDQAVWYLPHHAVVNPRKPKKLRVVFDCAAKFKGTSLNDQLLQGPDMTNNLVGVLTRFREGPVALAADIESMFLQVRVNPKDCDMLRFLWWPDGALDKRPSEFQMLVHLFGATSSPSCAGFALRKTADDNRAEFSKDVVNSVYRNFYVDDYLKSTKTVDEAKHLALELSQLLKRGGFRLTKWMSNSKGVLDTIPESERAKTVKKLNFERLPNERALGVHWKVELDRLGLEIEVKEKPLTRRGILSVMSSVYDPLGIVSPVMLPVKVLLQDLCKQDIGWDDPIPVEEMIKWKKWLVELPQLSNVSIPRCLEPPDLGEILSRELHHFGDASQTGYGAVSYLRSENANGEIHVSFLIGKSRLAPVKTTTIPRLELSAAVLAVKSDCMLRVELDLQVQDSFFWTDSTTVLRYISNEKKRFMTFVANRIAVIREVSSTQQWKYVDSKSNPADDASRGLSADEMKNDVRWLNGPEFLWQKRDLWPMLPFNLTQIADDDPEIKREKQVNLVQVTQEDILNTMFKGFSSWQRLRIAIAWLMRYKCFLVNAYRLSHGHKNTRELSYDKINVSELKAAEREIVKHVQRQSFQRELAVLKLRGCSEGNAVKNELHSKRKVVERSSPIYKLDPQLRDDMLCVGGRLSNAPISERAKHPPILPKNHHVCDLIIRHYHQMYGHAGKEHVLSLIRRAFWIINAKVAVRRLLDRCFDCRRRNAPPCEQIMADLPQDRLTPDMPPFSYVGVDFFGPIQVKRGRSVVKRYGCLFTCLTVRAVHIEITHTLETCSFIDALYRFINRRGKPLLIRSDNGSNFKGGERELRESIQEWNQQAVHKFLRQRDIEWIFNPPTASNMGGVWERLIRSVRQVLRVLLKEQIVDGETLLTVMTHVEAILNSRPLTPCSDDSKDEDPLTPNQILLLRNETCLPPGVFTKDDVFARRRWRQAQYLADQFWKRWVKEYLPMLQERAKWNRPRRNVATGDIVLVVDQNVPRGSWPLARVLEVHTAKDGYVRSAKVKTKTSILTRPINKLCLLEGVDCANQ